MKIELIKEASHDGIWYSILADGIYVSNTYTRELEKAEFFYKSLIESKGIPIFKEVLKSTEL